MKERTPGPLFISAGKRHDVLFSSWMTLFRSTNEGRSWKTLTCNNDIVVNDVAVPVNDPRTIYLATDLPEAAGYFPDAGELYRSTDGGVTWRHFTHLHPNSIRAYLGDFAREAEWVTVDPDFPRIVYLGTAGGGLLTSWDGGATWRPLLGAP